MAPELLLQKLYGHGVDIWSLGVTIYLLTFGAYPYNGRTEGTSSYRKETLLRSIMLDEPPPSYQPVEIMPPASPVTVNFIKELLRHDFKERKTASECLQLDPVRRCLRPHLLKAISSQSLMSSNGQQRAEQPVRLLRSASSGSAGSFSSGRTSSTPLARQLSRQMSTTGNANKTLLRSSTTHTAMSAETSGTQVSRITQKTGYTSHKTTSSTGSVRSRALQLVRQKTLELKVQPDAEVQNEIDQCLRLSFAANAIPTGQENATRSDFEADETLGVRLEELMQTMAEPDIQTMATPDLEFARLMADELMDVPLEYPVPSLLVAVKGASASKGSLYPR
jgi:serine/threonine protein kinase